MATEAPPRAAAPLSLARLDARLSVLERPEKKGWRESIKENGGLIALALSIVTGTYTVWDSAINQPRHAKQQAYSDFEKAIDEVTSINQSLSQLMASNVDDSSKLAGALQATTRKRSLIGEAFRLESNCEDMLNAADLIVLAVETAGQGNFKTGEQFATKALDAAKTDFDKSEILRNRAPMYFAAGDIADGERDFAQALSLLPGPALAAARAMLYGTWATAEASVGRCARIAPLTQRFNVAISAPSVDDRTRQAYVGSLLQQAKQVRNCTWSGIIPVAEAPSAPLPAASPPSITEPLQSLR